jgi:L-Ala-D/L-Glu epimerase
MSWSFSPVILKLKTTWKISRNSSDEKKNYIIKWNDQFAGEVAPNIRYGEEHSLVERQIQELFLLLETPHDLLTIDIESFFPSVTFAFDQIRLQYEQKLTALHFPRYLSRVETSFSIPIMAERDLEKYLYNNDSFNCYKIKVGEKPLEWVQSVQRLIPTKKLRVDANEAFACARNVLNFLDKVDASKIEFLEQPLPASSQEHAELKRNSPLEIIADESCHGVVDISKLQDQFHGINCKLMKCHSVAQAQDLIQQARSLNMKTMLGCMIETSMAIRYGFLLAADIDYFDLDGFLLIENDPFSKVQYLGKGILEYNL